VAPVPTKNDAVLSLKDIIPETKRDEKDDK